MKTLQELSKITKHRREVDEVKRMIRSGEPTRGLDALKEDLAEATISSDDIERMLNELRTTQ